MDDTAKAQLGEMEKKVNVIEAKLDRLITLFEANNRGSSVSQNPYVTASRNWISPFDSSGFGAFFDTSKLTHVHDERGLGKAELDESGDFRWKCNVSGYLPEELKVELDGDQLVVTGRHSESSEGESVYRLLKRRVIIPGVCREHLKCQISEDGWLSVEASNRGALHGDAEGIPINVLPCHHENNN